MEILCNPLTPPMFLLGDDWYALLGNRIVPGKPPITIALATKGTWNYTDLEGLANSGVYSPALLQIYDNISGFPLKIRQCYTIGMGITGTSRDFQSLAMTNLFVEDALIRLADSAWERVWSRFMTFGSASAAILGILVILRTIKYILDAIIYEYVLYRVPHFNLPGRKIR